MTDALVGRLTRGAGLAAVAAVLAGAPVPVSIGLVGATVVLFLPLIGLMAAAFGTPFASLWTEPLGAGGLTITPLLLAWTAAAWLLAELARRRLPSLDLPLVGPLTAFLAALALVAWRAPDVVAAGFEIARWFELALAFVLAASLARSPLRLRLLVLALLGAGTAAAAVGLWMARAGVGPEAFLILGGRLVRAYGTFGQPNPFGGYLNMVWPIGAALAAWSVAATLRIDWATGSGRRVPAWLGVLGAVACAVCGLAVVASWSRGAWLAAAAAAAVMLGAGAVGALRPPTRGRAAVLAWLGLVLVLALPATGLSARLPSSIAGRLGSIADTFTIWGVADAEIDDASFATIERVAHWEAAAAMWSDEPWLGQGPGHYESEYGTYRLPRWSEPLGHAHNYYLHLLAEAGIVGLVGFLVFFGAGVALAARRAVKPRSPTEGALALGLLGVLAAVAVHSMVDNVFVHETTVFLGLVMGATVAAGESA